MTIAIDRRSLPKIALAVGAVFAIATAEARLGAVSASSRMPSSASSATRRTVTRKS